MIINEVFNQSNAVDARSRPADQRELHVGVTDLAPEGLILSHYNALAGRGEEGVQLFRRLAPVAELLRSDGLIAWSDARAIGGLITGHNLWVCFPPDDIPEAVAEERDERFMGFRVAPVVGIVHEPEEGPLVPFLIVEGNDYRDPKDSTADNGFLLRPARDLELYVAIPEGLAATQE